MRSRLLVTLHATLLTGLALPSAALAADGESTRLDLSGGDGGIGSVERSSGGGGAIVRTIVGLLVVIAVIYGLAWVLRQVKSSREAGASGTALAPLASLPLAGDKALHLVRAGDTVVLVGTGPQGVTPVERWTLEEARARGLLDDEGEAPGAALIPQTDARLISRLRSITVRR